MNVIRFNFKSDLIIILKKHKKTSHVISSIHLRMPKHHQHRILLMLYFVEYESAYAGIGVFFHLYSKSLLIIIWSTWVVFSSGLPRYYNILYGNNHWWKWPQIWLMNILWKSDQMQIQLIALILAEIQSKSYVCSIKFWVFLTISKWTWLSWNYKQV